MNIEIASCLGINKEPFTLLTHGNYAKLFGYSAGWILFAIGLLISGIRFTSSVSRWAAIGLLIITVIKVFILDTDSLAMEYKIISFCVLSIGLFVVAYLYQRFVTTE